MEWTDCIHILIKQCQTCSPEKTLELVKADIDAFAGDNNSLMISPCCVWSIPKKWRGNL